MVGGGASLVAAVSLTCGPLHTSHECLERAAQAVQASARLDTSGAARAKIRYHELPPAIWDNESAESRCVGPNEPSLLKGIPQACYAHRSSADGSPWFLTKKKRSAMSHARIPIVTILVCLAAGHTSAITPRPSRPTMLKVAPDECVFFFHSRGFTAPDPNGNKTEQLFANPDVHRFVGEVGRLIEVIVENSIEEGDPEDAARSREYYELVKKLISQPMTFYVARFDLMAERFELGAVLDTGKHQAAVKDMMARLQGEAPKGVVKPLTVAGIQAYAIPPNQETGQPPIYWTMTGKTLIVTVGTDSLRALVHRLRTPDPDWLQGILTRLKLPRPALIAYLDCQKATEFLRVVDPEGIKVWQGCGLDKVQFAAFVAGLDERGLASRALVSVPQLTGLMKVFEQQPLTGQALKAAPRASVLACAFRLDLSAMLQVVESFAAAIDPAGGDQVRAGITQVNQSLGFDLQADLFDTVGDQWSIYQTVTESIVPDIVVAVKLRDPAKFARWVASFVEIARQAMTTQGSGGVNIEPINVDGNSGFSVQGLSVVPTWCVVGEQLVFAVSPTALKSHLTRAASNSASIVSEPMLKAAFDSKRRPIGFLFVDVKANLRSSYPTLKTAMQPSVKWLRQETGFEFDLNSIPPIESIVKYSEPSTFLVGRVADGIEFESRETIPQVSLGSSSLALTLLLPAVQAGWEAAKRNATLSDLREIGIAMLYHEKERGIYPAASKNGLSWRVHLLPYLGQQSLYDRFHLDEPWDSQHNRQLISLMPKVFAAPSAKFKRAQGKTNYLAVIGEDSVIATERGTRLSEFADSISQTLMIVEVDDPLAVVWTKPSDYRYDASNPTKGMGSLHPGHIFMAAFADAHTGAIPVSTAPETINGMYTKAGRERIAWP